MNNRIIFLGSTSDFNVLNNSQRSAGGIIIQSNNHQLLIDPGIGTLLRSAEYGIELSNTDIILISNNDLINTNDINAVAELLNKRSEKTVLITHKNLLKHEDSCLTKEHAKIFHIIEDDKNETTKTHSFDIKEIETKTDSLAFKIHTHSFILGYISKAVFNKKFIEEFKDSNIMIINCPDIIEKHNIKDIIEEINPELVILTGFGQKIIKEDPLDYVRTIKKELQENKSHIIKTQIFAAKDGMIINPDAYNIRIKQKSLKGFV